ncbi:MAG: protein rep, partial [Coleofasciculaceae cyanobacterium SM2_3_26]|nr:protein rep [Coleofasciculaceae cyanobacterium SM2_3_26]
LSAAIASIDSPEKPWLFLTLTVRNPELEELSYWLAKMHASWRLMRKLPDWKRAWVGGIRATEITWGRNQRPHPHYHVLLQGHENLKGSRRIPLKSIREDWKRALGVDYDPVSDIRYVINPTGRGLSYELVKYLTKSDPELFHPAIFPEIYGATYRMKPLNPFGSIRSALSDLGGLEELSDSDLIHAGEKEETPSQEKGEKITAYWNSQSRRYLWIP